jgi:general secretion pathway protein A
VYEQFYALERRPFDLTPDPRFLQLTPAHREALSHVEYALSGRVGLALLLGEPGTGKTTLLRAVRDRVPREADRVVTLDNPTLTRSELFELLNDEFQLGVRGASKARVLRALEAELTHRHAQGGTSALVVDEAQGLSDELLEEIRLLANIETPEVKLLSILLAAQPELSRRLNEPALRPLKQRIALRCALAPLTRSETAEYIAGRLRIAGGDPARTFTAEAVAAICAHAGGIPRAINVVCENALISGFALALRPVDRDVIVEVCRDLDVEPNDEPPFSSGDGASSGGRAGTLPATSAPAISPRAPSAAALAPPRPALMPAALGPSAPTAASAASVPAALPGTTPRSGQPRGERPKEKRRRLLGVPPFWNRRRGASVQLTTEYFEVAGQRGVLLTPVQMKGAARRA